jgi:hypothetical protein
VTSDQPGDWPESDPEDQLPRFRASSGGSVTARFDATQAALIRGLVGQVADLIAAESPPASAAGGQDELAAELGLSQHAELPDDPVLARLLPDAYSDDPEASAEFRRYTETGLRSAKVEAAMTVLETLPARGGKVRLAEPESQAWLRALNDVRLALSVRLGVTDDFDEDVARMPPDDPRAGHVWVYQMLGYLQESLVEALW